MEIVCVTEFFLIIIRHKFGKKLSQTLSLCFFLLAKFNDLVVFLICQI